MQSVLSVPAVVSFGFRLPNEKPALKHPNRLSGRTCWCSHGWLCRSCTIPSTRRRSCWGSYDSYNRSVALLTGTRELGMDGDKEGGLGTRDSFHWIMPHLWHCCRTGIRFQEAICCPIVFRKKLLFSCSIPFKTTSQNVKFETAIVFFFFQFVLFLLSFSHFFFRLHFLSYYSLIEDVITCFHTRLPTSSTYGVSAIRRRMSLILIILFHDTVTIKTKYTYTYVCLKFTSSCSSAINRSNEVQEKVVY